MPLILVIEDSLYMRREIRDILEGEGYTIAEAENGLKGIQLATTGAPDCILLDLIMPGIDGIKILTLLQEQRPQIPVIVVSAHGQEAVHTQCLELGASACINKPPSADELRYTVQKVLVSHRKPS